MSDLYRLVYASKNLLHGSDAEIAEAVAQILEASRRNNAKVDVTGALMFNAGAFAQVLEGPRRGVESTFERIQRDTRHGDVTVLQCGPTEGRSFANWSMGFVGQSASGCALWNDIAAESGFDLSRVNGDAVFAMLHQLVLEEEGMPVAASALPYSAPITAPLPKTLDVERVRSELVEVGPARPDPVSSEPASGSIETTPQTASTNQALANGPKTNAALMVIRAALASERSLTNDLRNDLDEMRVMLALSQERVEALTQERDLWARRAKLLAIALSQEAEEVIMSSTPVETAASNVTPHSRTGASIKAVA